MKLIMFSYKMPLRFSRWGNMIKMNPFFNEIHKFKLHNFGPGFHVTVSLTKMEASLENMLMLELIKSCQYTSCWYAMLLDGHGIPKNTDASLTLVLLYSNYQRGHPNACVINDSMIHSSGRYRCLRYPKISWVDDIPSWTTHAGAQQNPWFIPHAINVWCFFPDKIIFQTILNRIHMYSKYYFSILFMYLDHVRPIVTAAGCSLVGNSSTHRGLEVLTDGCLVMMGQNWVP